MDMTTEAKHPPDCPWHQDWHKCNCGLFDFISYWEPTPSGQFIKNEKHQFSKEEAINKQIDYAWKYHQYRYETQEEALQDFIAVNWAIENRHKI
jgi:hypothetical protein